MFKLTIMAVLVAASLLFCGEASAQAHQHNGQWHNHFQNQYHYHNIDGSVYFRQPQVYYAPRVQWLQYGTNLNVGPVYVSPNRRYVRFGINAGFSTYRGFNTFNFRTGQSRYYGR